MSKKKVIVVLLISSLLIVACSNNQAQNNQIYKIGLVTPLTGPGAQIGQAFYNGMQLAVEDSSSQSGINGYQIKLITQDGQLDGKTSANAAKFLIQAENIDIASSVFWVTAQATSPVFKESGVPMFYEAYTRDILENNEIAIKTDFDAEAGCQVLMQYVQAHDQDKKIGVLMSNANYNEACLKGIKKVQPDILEYRYNFGEKDFRTLLSKSNHSGVDKLITLGIDFEFLAIFQQIEELNLPIKMICATAKECIFDDVIDNVDQSILSGTLAIDYLSPNLKDISQTEVSKKLTAKYGDKLTLIDYSYGATGYHTFQIISQALKSCQPGGKECIREALENVQDYNSVIGSHGFKDRVLQLDYQIYEWQDGEWRGVE